MIWLRPNKNYQLYDIFLDRELTEWCGSRRTIMACKTFMKEREASTEDEVIISLHPINIGMEIMSDKTATIESDNGNVGSASVPDSTQVGDTVTIEDSNTGQSTDYTVTSTR